MKTGRTAFAVRPGDSKGILLGKERGQLAVGFVHDLLHAGAFQLGKQFGQQGIHIAGARPQGQRIGFLDVHAGSDFVLHRSGIKGETVDGQLLGTAVELGELLLEVSALTLGWGAAGSRCRRR